MRTKGSLDLVSDTVHVTVPWTLPNAPNNLRALFITDTSFTVFWDDRSINETGYTILLNGGIYEALSSNQRNVSITGLSASTQYDFGVFATNTAGSSDTIMLTVMTLESVIDTTDDMTDSQDTTDMDLSFTVTLDGHTITLDSLTKTSMISLYDSSANGKRLVTIRPSVRVTVTQGMVDISKNISVFPHPDNDSIMVVFNPVMTGVVEMSLYDSSMNVIQTRNLDLDVVRYFPIYTLAFDGMMTITFRSSNGVGSFDLILRE